MNEIATNDFDYSLLDAKTKEFLEERANIIYGIPVSYTHLTLPTNSLV